LVDSRADGEIGCRAGIPLALFDEAVALNGSTNQLRSKIVKKVICTTIFLTQLLALGMHPALAADETRLGYVDVRKVLSESKAGKTNKTALDKLIKQKQAALENQEKDLKTMQQSFEKEQLTLTDAQKKEKQKAFQEKLQAFQKLRNDSEREVRQKDGEFSKQAMIDIQAIIHEIAEQEKLLLVFEKNQMPVLYAQGGPDLTDKVLKQYDAKFGK
jgi:outer membrane protein